MIFIVSYSGAFHTIQIGGFLRRFQFYLYLAFILFLALQIIVSILSIITQKVIFGNILLEFITSILIAAVGFIVNNPLIIMLSEKGKPILTDAEIFANYFIFSPVYLICISFTSRAISSHLSKSKSIMNSDSKIEANSNVQPYLQRKIAFQNYYKTPIYLEADDHHVKAVFENQVIFRRKKLIQEIQNLKEFGIQVHRSYWVNTSHILKKGRMGRQLYVILKDGTQIPVGRSYEKIVAHFFESRNLLEFMQDDFAQRI